MTNIPHDNINQLAPVNVPAMEWADVPLPFINATINAKMLHVDETSGMSVQIVKYRAGFTNTWHNHPCGHGMYVLEGVLRTHQGDYPKDTWVWFDEGGWMEHGATEEQDVTVLFVTDKAFDICYYGEER